MLTSSFTLEARLLREPVRCAWMALLRSTISEEADVHAQHGSAEVHVQGVLHDAVTALRMLHWYAISARFATQSL